MLAEFSEIIIVGAGACGLAAGYELTRNGKKVLLLEADDRIGGRIKTIHHSDFDMPVEAGAEFIHGNLPVTIELLNTFKIPFLPAGGKMIRIETQPSKAKRTDTNYGLLALKLRAQKEDCTVMEFLNNFFPEDKGFDELRSMVKGFVSGYDTADPDRASLFAFRDEWMDNDEWEQYRVAGGYGKLTDALAKDIREKGGRILTSRKVLKVTYHATGIELTDSEGRIYNTERAIITIPLGLLQNNSVHFDPPLPVHFSDLQSAGYGRVIKVVCSFRNPFWENHKEGGDIGFILSDATIPTWWTMSPQKSNMLCGWIGWGLSEKYTGKEELVKRDAMSSLASIFKMKEEELKEECLSCQVFDWNADPHAMGSYSYTVPGAEAIFRECSKPINRNLFFCGEAFYSGKIPGTVEAALSSGMETAGKILAESNQ